MKYQLYISTARYNNPYYLKRCLGISKSTSDSILISYNYFSIWNARRSYDYRYDFRNMGRVEWLIITPRLYTLYECNTKKQMDSYLLDIDKVDNDINKLLISIEL